jgi:hypothetical protein
MITREWSINRIDEPYLELTSLAFFLYSLYLVIRLCLKKNCNLFNFSYNDYNDDGFLNERRALSFNRHI